MLVSACLAIPVRRVDLNVIDTDILGIPEIGKTATVHAVVRSPLR